MKNHHFDVIVVGAGPAGVAAAGALAGSGVSVAMLETGVYAGAENWSGCVYFTENLAEPDCFGRNAVDTAPFERRVVRRGTLLHNCLDVVGLELNDAAAFQNCYTVLRPVYDPYFAHLACRKGAVLIAGTTVTSLIRNKGSVAGVHTNRGPLYADVVFIAEGDASHLVHAERLERVARPHFLQGVKAVLSLPAGEIEKRFQLGQHEGAAYELLIRNGAIAGRTAHLNIGGFLYTNRDSLSIGCVVPLENLRDNYRGSHDQLLEWMRTLPYVREMTEGAVLSAYGAKLIRSGGWNEQPVLVQDGLAVGGASAGLGVDMPFPNFTGPASATGLFFARAVKNVIRLGNPFDARNLEREYAAPIRESMYGKNARSLSAWPDYFGSTRVLFSRTTDVVCGSAHFMAKRSTTGTGRFLGTQILSFRGLRELVSDTLRAVRTLGLGSAVLKTLVNPVTIGRWCANLLSIKSAGDARPVLFLCIAGKEADAKSFPWPIGPFLKRLSPALTKALARAYANDGKAVRDKFSAAVTAVLQGLRLTDLIVLPAYAIVLVIIAASTAALDAFRYYILRTPADRMLKDPVRLYAEQQRKARDLGAAKPSAGIEAKLATNTYHVGGEPHIRTLWPDSPVKHGELAEAGLWHICPARVYAYDAPALAGRGRVSVDYENCIKCESCWRSDPGRVLWGRHTEHRLVYRPESAALPILLESLRSGTSGNAGNMPVPADAASPLLAEAGLRSCRSTLNALSAFGDAVSHLPRSADAARRSWPSALGKRLAQKLVDLETELKSELGTDSAEVVKQDRIAIEQLITQGELFVAWYRCRGLEQMLLTWLRRDSSVQSSNPAADEENDVRNRSAAATRLFPDRIVQQWENEPVPESWAKILHAFINDRRDTPENAVRSLSSVNPALGLVAGHHFSAIRMLKQAGISLEPGVAAISGDGVEIQESMDSIRIRGTLRLVPIAACRMLLIAAQGRGHLVPLGAPGVVVRTTPGIGFRAAGLSDVSLDCTIKKYAVVIPPDDNAPASEFVVSLALGAADYLCRRMKEHATARVQFSGQMLDTEGRDGIAKLGAVKAMLARSEAWRCLLKTLFARRTHSATDAARDNAVQDLLGAALAARAFGPEPGELGYDAGQVFGGFAYSEDDLLARYYRDSAMFRYLAPLHRAGSRLRDVLTTRPELLKPHDLQPVASEPLGANVRRLSALAVACAALPIESDAGLAGEAQAMVLGIRSLVTETERRLEQGASAELEAACMEILLGLAEETAHKAALSAGRDSISPAPAFPLEPAAGTAIALDLDYESFCQAPGNPHQSGNFLTLSFDQSPRFVPEMQLHDQKLRDRWTELAAWFRKNCRDPLFDGMPLERRIEAIHGLPAEIIDAIRKHKWLAATIPVEDGGLGWRKAEYYILNAVAGSYGDAGIDLLIMANTSIGTTPVLLGLEDELPRVREELTPLATDKDRLGEIGVRLGKIVASLAHPDPNRIRSEYEALMRLVDGRVRHTRVVKYLAANFLRAFYGAGIAGKRGDFAVFSSQLKQANELFGQIVPDVLTALDELPRRERCLQLFLRKLAAGGVSAFALTEPTAGSDSGGIKTTAKPRQARLTPMDDGRYSFLLNEDDRASVRYLIDADQLDFVDGEMVYRTPDGRNAAIHHTGSGSSYRFRDEERVFHDISQVRKNTDGFVYDFFTLTGSKMWITNGSIATQFCLYAQSPEGVTGFVVDRFSEGLTVGADERKMGQRGSPTNEIAIDAVRVPREAVIGYEGHGQVNALETLNVGRCGLAVVSGALMRKLMAEARAAIPASPETERLLGEAAAVLFGSESLAFYLVGLFDRPHESVRMESAIAKYACSEDLHEFIGLLENAYGPDGLTEKYYLEKARRDARILTIYEGTNEVQRFLILRDLVALAGAWPEIAEQSGDAAHRDLALWKNRLRQQVRDVAALLGDAAWSDAMLQPALFPLTEMAGEILRLECILYRIAWIGQHAAQLSRGDPDYAAPLLAAARRAVVRSNSRLARLHETFLQHWQQVKSNNGPSEIRAADAALDQAAYPAVSPEFGNEAAIPQLRMLCVVRPVADPAPMPRLVNGELAEIVWTADPLDRSALDQALGLKTRSGRKITVEVLIPAQKEHEQLLRTIAAPADRLVRVACGVSDARAISEAIRELEQATPYDVILIGDVCLNGDRGIGFSLGGALGRTCIAGERLGAVTAGNTESRRLPMILSITTRTSEATRSMDALVSAASVSVETVGTPAASTITPLIFSRPSATVSASPTVATASGAAGILRAFAASSRSSQEQDVAPPTNIGRIAGEAGIWVMLDPREPQANSAALGAGRYLADMNARPLCALVMAPRDAWPQLLGRSRARGADRAWCVDSGTGMLSSSGRMQAVKMLIGSAPEPVIVAGPRWLDAFRFIAGERGAEGAATPVFGDVVNMEPAGRDQCSLFTPAYDRRLLRKVLLHKGAACISVLPAGVFPQAAMREGFFAEKLEWVFGADAFVPLPAEETPTLSQAEVIIDLGYGIGDRSGLLLAEELKAALEALGLAPLFGATRKVTQDLKLQPLEAQIGQTGVRVDPKLVIALGVSGAPQHIDYIGQKAEIYCFNKDPDAPLMQLNKTRLAPRVHPIVGDLRLTVRECIDLLRRS